MNAVWSFWTKPYLEGRGQGWCSGWHTEWHHLLAWGLSVYAAATHYPETSLVTDDLGARILVDGLQLPFVTVSTALNRLKNEDPQWWALGKLEAYRSQRGPFVHIDTDVFLWQRLSRELEQAAVFTQNPEWIVPGASCYRPGELERCLQSSTRAWIPPEWTAYGIEGTCAACCGIFGGSRIDFIHRYADAAVRMVTAPANRRAIESLPGRNGHMILVEQYLLTACCQFHQVPMSYLFATLDDAVRPDCATAAGYTHLASSAKSDAVLCEDLDQRVERDLPRYYERCLRWAEKYQRAQAG
ncbi:MAG: hypothetical protein HYX46_07530 [Betaproteobacteria bacterium]|nr:hypothetical protein [Betaproteobacteria bacterium]